MLEDSSFFLNVIYKPPPQGVPGVGLHCQAAATSRSLSGKAALPPPNAPNAPNASDLIWHCPTPLVEVNQTLLALSIDNQAKSQSFQN